MRGFRCQATNRPDTALSVDKILTASCQEPRKSVLPGPCIFQNIVYASELNELLLTQFEAEVLWGLDLGVRRRMDSVN